MSIGLKRETVYLEDHQSTWEETAADTIRLLKSILGEDAADIRHVGSTSIRSIRAKPIIDIAVAVNDFWDVLRKKKPLEAAGIFLRLDERPVQLLYVMGDLENDFRTHHIHVVPHNSAEWRNYINFRDYLNANLSAAKEYEKIKLALAEKYPLDRRAYTDGKCAVISKLLSEAEAWRKRSETILTDEALR
ncbi:MAG: GrpB family protein [Clostridia bacterium]|nr:GrpB family protein [Clostridia bacterium]